MYKLFVFLLMLMLSGCQGWSLRHTAHDTPLHFDNNTQNLPIYKVILTLNDFHFELEIQKQPSKESVVAEDLQLDQDLSQDLEQPSTNTDPDTDPDTNPDTDPDTDPDTNPDTNPDTDPDTNPETQTSPEESLSPFLNPDADWMILPDF